MASAGTVTVDFAAETARFTAELKKVQSSLTRLEGGFTSLTKTMDFAKKFFSGAVLVSFAKSALEAASATATAAERAGVAVESFSRLQYAAKITDTDMGALTEGIKKLQLTMSEAGAGSANAAAKFARFGVTLEQLRGLNVEQQLGVLADALVKVQNPADRTRLAVEFFGRSAGPQLVPFLAQGSEGIRALTQRADDLGITLQRDTAAGIAEAEKALKTFMATASGLTVTFLGGVVLGFERLKDEYGPAGEDLKGLQRQLNEAFEERRAILKKIAEAQQAIALTGRVGEAILGTALEKKNAELAAVEARLNAINAQLLALSQIEIDKAGQANVPVPELPFSEIDLEPIRALRIETDEWAEALARFDAGVAANIAERNADTLRAVGEVQLDTQRTFEERITSDLEAELEKRSQIRTYYREKDAQDEIDTREAIGAVTSGFYNAGMDALQTFSGENEKAAKAMVAINKAQAIAQAIQNTAVAVTKAYAQGGVYGIAMAAGIAALGAAQVALIARSGYGQMQQIQKHGGAPIGSPSNPVITQPQAGPGDVAGGERVVQVVVNGNFFGSRQTVDYLIEQFREEINGKDVVLFSPTSRQAQEIRGP